MIVDHKRLTADPNPAKGDLPWPTSWQHWEQEAALPLGPRIRGDDRK